MKRITQQIMDHTQKRRIAKATGDLVKHLFEENLDKEQVPHVLSDYFKNGYNHEFIMKQSLSKAVLSKTTWTKHEIVKINNGSGKLSCESLNERSDVRVIPEVLTADYIAKDHPSITKILILQENNRKNSSAVISSSTNKNPDTMIFIKSDNNPDLAVCFDVKSGDNLPIFSNVISQIPLTPSGEAFYIMNKGNFTPQSIHDSRMDHLNHLIIRFPADRTELKELKQTCEFLKEQGFDEITSNVKIQEHMLRFLGNNPSCGSYFKPSLFSFRTITNHDGVVNEEFFRSLEPHIHCGIFDNGPNSRHYIREALFSYEKTVGEIYKNVNHASKTWGDTGFQNIAKDLFD